MNNKLDSNEIEKMVCDMFMLQRIDRDIDAIDNFGNLYEIKACRPYIIDKSHKNKKRSGRFWFSDKDFENPNKTFIFVIYDIENNTINIKQIFIYNSNAFFETHGKKRLITWEKVAGLT